MISRKPWTSHSTRCSGGFLGTSTVSNHPALQGQPAAVREADQRRISRRPRCGHRVSGTERERVRITQAKPGDKVRIARAMVYVDQRQAKRVAALAVARERYKARLQEVARSSTPTEHRAREPCRRVPGIGRQPPPHSRLQGRSGDGRALQDRRAAVDR